ncbi:restriction endonuclease subunit S [Vibrio sp. HENC-03]|uniref:restriction endonuclease subunit S n=1 Tax=Vibrio sp. HENC-03 TaxID=992012 RepID=UPI00028D0CC5|nr:restriction endonuclease subunit S [Vibrio sp. HENC-03]EKM26834.1 type I restriction modification DNA specificity domain protein [Vibrio sp. HENC-03]
MVPNGWLKTDLNPFIDIKHGFAFKSEYFREEGEYVLLTPGSFYEPGGFRDQKSKTKYYVGDIPKGYLLSKGELLVAMTEQAAGLLGSTLFVPSHDRYLHNQRLGLIQIKDKNGICPEFLYLTYNSPYVRKQIAEQSTGTKVKHTSPDKLKSVICLLPPLPEQRKIAQILSTWDRGIATTEKLIDASKQQKKALMQQLLTGKKRLVDPETGKAFEGEWEEVRLIDTVSKEKYSFTGGPFGSDLKSSDYTENGVRIIQLQNIGDGTFHNSYQIFTSQEKADELVSCNIFPDDIIISKMGDPVARATLIPHIHQRYLMASDGIRLAIDKSKYNNRFILETINYREFRNNALAKSTGSTRRRIGLTDLKNIKFRVPELIEQQKIASVLTAADKEIELLEAKLAHFKQEKKALMQQLLTGKRRVSLSS